MNVKHTNCIVCRSSLLKTADSDNFPLLGDKRMPICKKCMKEIDDAKFAYTEEQKEEHRNLIISKIANNPAEVQDSIIEYIDTNNDVLNELQFLRRDYNKFKKLAVIFMIVSSLLLTFIVVNTFWSNIAGSGSNAISQDIQDIKDRLNSYYNDSYDWSDEWDKYWDENSNDDWSDLDEIHKTF